MAQANPQPQIKFSEQNILNNVYDDIIKTLATTGYGWNGQQAEAFNADNLATKITVSGSYTYVAKAAPGTDQATAKWQCKKIDESSGTVITFADGDANFDNVAIDLPSLTYS